MYRLFCLSFLSVYTLGEPDEETFGIALRLHIWKTRKRLDSQTTSFIQISYLTKFHTNTGETKMFFLDLTKRFSSFVLAETRE
jgi:hypothetical protein